MKHIFTRELVLVIIGTVPDGISGLHPGRWTRSRRVGEGERTLVAFRTGGSSAPELMTGMMECRLGGVFLRAGLCMLVLAVCVVAKEPKHLSTKPPIGRTSMGDRLDPCTNACRQHACPLALTQCTWLAYFCHRIRRRSLRRASARAMAAVHAHFVCTSTLTSLLSTGRQ